MLDLKKYLLPSDKYVIIRMDDIFPQYEHRSDIDIVCNDTKYMSKLIKQRHPGNLQEHFPEGHHHLDYHNDKGLNLKFDLIDNFKYFKNVKVSDNFKTDLINNIVFVERFNHFWRIPTQNYETIIRYIEWIEYPHKEKHKKYFDKNKNLVVESLISKYLEIKK